MYLPLRIAASLFVTIVVCGAMAVALWYSLQSKLPLSLSIMQSGGLVLFAGAFMLPVVLPNVAAAWMANSFAAPGGPLLYIGMFIVIFLLLWFMEVNALSRFIGAGSFDWRGFDWKLGAYLAANIIVCLAAAWWYGRATSA